MFVYKIPPLFVKEERVRPVKVGEAALLIPCIVFIVPELLSVKFVELNVAIPLVPVEFALSMVIVVLFEVALAKVNDPLWADPPDPPVMLNTPVLFIVTAPVAPDTLIPVPPMLLVTPVLESVSVPPRDTGEPPTPRPVPPVTVIWLF